MNKIYSKVKKDLLCHMIVRLDDIVERTNISDDQQFLQLATLRLDKGTTFRPHKHIWKPAARDQVIAQESWVVFRGQVQVTFYDIDDSILQIETLNAGDCSMTYEGGHTYLILEDNTVVYEYKTGPYQGQHLDKVFIN